MQTIVELPEFTKQSDKILSKCDISVAAAAYNMAKLLAWFYWPKYFSALFNGLVFEMRSPPENAECLVR